MREYKIVEMKDGHGNPKYIVKAKYGWKIFSCWEQHGNTLNSMKEAQDAIKEFMKEYKDWERIKVKEYVYSAVPNHVPEEQIGKFMEIKEIDK